ncbi:MAG: GAP family protein, partial [Ilumatobacteraceae bacterium]
ILASLDPLRPVVFVLVLRTKRINALAFLVGWAIALSLLFVVVFVLFGGDPAAAPGSDRRTWISVAELLVGVLLTVFAARRWERRAEMVAKSLAPEAVLRRLDQLGPRQAGLIGVLIQPRTLTIAAALVVARDRSGVLSLLIGFAVFAIVSTAALLAILLYDTRRPESAATQLESFVGRLEAQGPVLFTILCACAGVYLIADSIYSLVT